MSAASNIGEELPYFGMEEELKEGSSGFDEGLR